MNERANRIIHVFISTSGKIEKVSHCGFHKKKKAIYKGKGFTESVVVNDRSCGYFMDLE